MKGRIIRPENETTRLRFPRIGKIKIGMKNAKGFPQSVDYFIATGKYAGLFAQAYGDKPQTIQIVFPDDDPETVCCQRYEYRDDGGRLIASGDGETFKVWDGNNYITMTHTQYPNIMDSIGRRFPNKEYQKTGDGWRVRLTLNFIIPLVRGVVGVWTFETNGNASTIPQITDAFDTMLIERGFAKGIIFDLNVKFATTQKPGDNSRFPVVSLVANESAENIARIKRANEPLQIENK